MFRPVELHNHYGGGRQGGIAPSAQTPNVLVFTDRSVGEQHGYLDRWEGSTLHYTGEGQRGEQTMDHGNRAIRDHLDQNRAIRVFDGVSGEVTYLGEFELDPKEPHYTARAPETDNGPLRKVIMFRLVPVGSFHHDGTETTAADLTPSLWTRYRTADETVSTEQRIPFDTDPDRIDRGLRAHRRVQNALADYVTSIDADPGSPGLGDPPFDAGWWRGKVFFVAEVKSITDTNETSQLRLGLGQVLDYGDQIEQHGHQVRRVLAVERQPTGIRWVELCDRVGVLLSWPDDWPGLQ